MNEPEPVFQATGITWCGHQKLTLSKSGFSQFLIKSPLRPAGKLRPIYAHHVSLGSSIVVEQQEPSANPENAPKLQQFGIGIRNQIKCRLREHEINTSGHQRQTRRRTDQVYKPRHTRTVRLICNIQPDIGPSYPLPIGRRTATDIENSIMCAAIALKKRPHENVYIIRCHF